MLSIPEDSKIRPGAAWNLLPKIFKANYLFSITLALYSIHSLPDALSLVKCSLSYCFEAISRNQVLCRFVSLHLKHSELLGKKYFKAMQVAI
jgi:hypothetical protein